MLCFDQIETNRRDFLQQSSFGLAIVAALQASPPYRILLRSSWQTVNIGDIAHTPGVLRLLEEYLPDAEVWLYPSNLKNGVDQILRARFPKLRIAMKGSKELQHAYEVCDFLLHGSGPSLVAEKHVVEWSQKTGKPYGVRFGKLPTRRPTAIARAYPSWIKSICLPFAPCECTPFLV